MPTVENVDRTGCIVLGEQVIHFDVGRVPPIGDPVLVLHQDNIFAIETLEAGISDAMWPRFITIERPPKGSERTIVSSYVMLIGAVTRVEPRTNYPSFPVTAEGARHLKVAANTGPGLRERVHKAIVAAASNGEVEVTVEVRDAPIEDFTALGRELHEAGFYPNMSGTLAERRDYGDKADLNVLTIGWHKLRD